MRNSILKIIDGIDLKELKKFGFKEVQQGKRINYIYLPNQNAWENSGNSITVFADNSIFTMDRHIDEDRIIEFRFNERATYDFNKTIKVLYDLIKAGLVEEIKER